MRIGMVFLSRRFLLEELDAILRMYLHDGVLHVADLEPPVAVATPVARNCAEKIAAVASRIRFMKAPLHSLPVSVNVTYRTPKLLSLHKVSSLCTVTLSRSRLWGPQSLIL